jgi:hypothetical protein
VNAYLPLFLGFLGALLVGAGVLHSRVSEPMGTVMTGFGVALLSVVALIYLLVLLGAIALA